jgi:hypothetical protein
MVLKNAISKKLHSWFYWENLKRKNLVPKMGTEQINRRGHRRYVGGKWRQLGVLQYEFMLKNGLKTHHKLYDIGCGSLRAGVHFIPYLNKGNYFGIDREPDLIKAGLEYELVHTMVKEKKPEFAISTDFEFEKFTCAPDFGLAQSLFTHLTLKDIKKCLLKLKEVSTNGCQLFATFDEEGITPKAKKRKGIPNPPWSHSNLTFYYNYSDIKGCAKDTGWECKYIGEWGHPAGQQMVHFWC